MRLPILDARVEHGRQHRVGADLGVEGVHQALDHGLGDPGPLGDLGSNRVRAGVMTILLK